LIQQKAGYVHDEVSIPHGQQLARTRWNTHASGEAFDQKKQPYLTDRAREFLSQQSFCVLAGLDAQNELEGFLAMEEPGFVQTLDDSTCLLRLSSTITSSRLMQRVQCQSESGTVTHLGLFFIHHPTRERLCVHGTAEILQVEYSRYFTDDQQCSSIWVLLHVQQSFFHCTKYIRTRVAGLTFPVASPPSRSWQREQLIDCDSRWLSQTIQAYIADQVLCYLCTVDHAGICAINHRGGASGFLVTLPPDEQAPGGMLLLPDYAGNGAFEAIGNIFETEQATIIIPDYTSQLALRVSGTAQVLEVDELSGELAQKCIGAERVIALSVQRVMGQGGDWTTSLTYEQQRAASDRMPENALEVCPLSQ
jgi:hypothetical protein